MISNGLADKIYVLCNWIAKLIYLNILWIAFSLLGLLVAGFFPATIAMFSVTRKWLMKEDTPIFKTFWKTYSEDFLKANMLGYILTVIGYILFLEFKFFQITANPIYRPVALLFIVLLVIYVAMILFVIPMFVHYEMKLHKYIKYAFLMAMGRIVQSFVMIMGSVILYFIFSQIPGLIPFLSGSIFSLLLMWIASKSFLQMSSD